MENPGIHQLQFKSVDQIGIAVHDIDKVIESWSKLFGIGPWKFREMGGTDGKGRPWKGRLAFAYLGPLEIELIQPVEGRIVQSRFLDTYGEGIHHLGFYVDDVEAELENILAQGAKLVIKQDGDFAYLESGGPGGVLWELIRRPQE